MADILFATNRFPGDGITTQFEIAFSGGYMDRAHVKAYIEVDTTGIRTPITATDGMFIGPNTINLGVAAPVGSTMVLYRDTPKDAPLVDFTNGSRITEANLDKVAQQAVFIGAEVYDSTRVGEVLALLEDAGAEANASAAAALVSQGAAAISAAAALAYQTGAGVAQSATAASASAAAIAASDADADAIATAALAASLAGGSMGFSAAAYDFGSITDPNTYFNLDFGTVP